MSKINKISEILSIIKEEDLIKEFAQFEVQLFEGLHDLRVLLNKDVRSTDNINLLDNLSKTDSFRERLSRYYSLCVAFYDHSQSSIFNISKEGKVTAEDKRAYSKKLGAGFKGLMVYMEDLIRATESRINTLKAILNSNK